MGELEYFGHEFHECPVCGFAKLVAPAWDEHGGSQEVCPSCGIQFGIDDDAGGDEWKRQLIWHSWPKPWWPPKRDEGSNGGNRV